MTLAFKKLLWKDVHINRVLLGVAVLLLALPYPLALLMHAYSVWHYGYREPWPILLMYASLWSLGLSILSVTLLGGNAVAGERADRSAEFLASVPVSRRGILTSKALVVFTVVVLVWLINSGLIYSLTPDLAQQASGYRRDRDDGLSLIALTMLLAAGMAWGCSCCLRSPVLAVCAGLGAPLVIGMVLAIVSHSLPDNTTFRPVPWYAAACLVLGLVVCVGGTWHYLRRVEP